MWFDDLRLIEDDMLHKMTPEIVADIFCSMDSRQQASFFNHVAVVASKWSGSLYMQLQWITDEDGLNLAGRRVMQSIGEYSHWGLVDQLGEDKLREIRNEI